MGLFSRLLRRWAMSLSAFEGHGSGVAEGSVKRGKRTRKAVPRLAFHLTPLDGHPIGRR